MADNLRQLLIQRGARLQERPALTTAAWGTLSYAKFRNRVEGVALGLLAADRPVGFAIHGTEPGPWTWASEVAGACCGLRWDAAGGPVEHDILGGPRFNDEHGRGPYHEREHEVDAGTVFSGGLDHGALLLRLQRMNRSLGWDHDSTVPVPLAAVATPEGRAALWCALYGGSHAILMEPGASPPSRFGKRKDTLPAWDPTPFEAFWN